MQQAFFAYFSNLMRLSGGLRTAVAEHVMVGWRVAITKMLDIVVFEFKVPFLEDRTVIGLDGVWVWQALLCTIQVRG